MQGRDSRIANSQTKAAAKRKNQMTDLPAAVHSTIDNPQGEKEVKEKLFVVKPKQNKEFDAESKTSNGNLLHNKDFLE